jgi:hypothetical protein
VARLFVNADHVATLRPQRGTRYPVPRAVPIGMREVVIELPDAIAAGEAGRA